MRQQVYAPTSLCANKFMRQQVYAPTSLCANNLSNARVVSAARKFIAFLA